MAGYFNRRIINFTIFISVIFIVVQFFSCHNISAAPCSSGWVLQNRVPTSETLKKITFVDSHNGYITGENGVVVNSTDGGKSWNLRKDLSNPDNLDFVFLDNNTYCCVRKSGEILKTTDGGKSWKSIYSRHKIDFRNPGYVKFYSTKSLLFFAVSPQSDWSSCILFRSMDKGDTWQEITQKKDFFINNIFEFKPHEELIYARSMGGWQFCSNNGIKWSVIKFPEEGHIRQLYFYDDKNGWLVSKNSVYHSHDKGKNWSYLCGFDEHFHIDGMSFANPSIGIMVGFDINKGQTFFRTEDGGKSWQQIKGFEHLPGLVDVHLSSSLEGWVTGQSGAIIHTVDGGKTWTEQTAGYSGSLQDVVFFDKNNGLAVGGELAGITKQIPAILNTADGGKTWTEKYCNKALMLNRIIAESPDCYTTASFTPPVLLDSRSQKTVFSEKLYTINDFRKSDKQTYWLVGWSKAQPKSTGSMKSSLIQSTDQGKSWKLVKIFSGNPCKIAFINSNEGFVYASWFIEKTNDGGKTWTPVKLEEKIAIEKIFFDEEKNGWLLGRDEKDYIHTYVVLKSNDSGKTWTRISQPRASRAKLLDIFFVNSTTGWITGEDGIILKTTDGGKTWKQQSSGTANNLNKIFFIDDKTGWIVGDFGTILFTETGGE